MPGKKPPLRQIRFEAPFSRGVGGVGGARRSSPLGGRRFGAGDELGPPVIPPYQNREPGCEPGAGVWTPDKPSWQPADPPARDIPTNGMILGHPIVLVATCVVNPGDRQTPNVLALRCPDNKAFLLEEIRFGAVGDYAGFVAVDLGASIGCLLGLDQERMLTPSIVPVSMFDAPFRQTHEAIPAAPGVSMQGSISRWRLPKPLYLAPGEVLIPTFEHFGLSNAACTIYVTYHGRVVVSGKPAVTRFPFCIAWRPPSFDISAVTPTTLVSTEKDLINPFQQPLRVVRFGGRLYLSQANLSGVATTAITELAQGVALADGTRVGIRASRGSDVVRVPGRWLSVFDGETKGWEVDHILPSSDHYVVTVDTGQNTTVTGVSGIAYVSMMGYREVK